MCGICGIVNKDGSEVNSDLLYKMTRILKHRGDDAHGIKIIGNAGLGHQRLSIIDLSEKANQPFPSFDGRYWIVYNGEVYNFIELRDELKKKYNFITTSDAEVVLYAWMHWGEECLERFNGMFAFSIWDSFEKVLYCVRDRMGVKPFFYHNADVFVFASEIKSLLIHPKVSKNIDYTALSDYLSLGYITGEKTIFENIRRLPPAIILKIERDGKLRFRRYWDVRKYFNLKVFRQDDLCNNIKVSLEKAVKRRLISDIDIGFFISGGVDSSAVIKFARKYYNKLQAFSLGFPQSTYNELLYAKRFAQEMGYSHNSTMFYSPSESFLRTLMYFFDQPFADNSSVPTFQLCKFVSQGVNVVLSGDGGDEMFGGYETYRADLFAKNGQQMVPFWKLSCKILSKILRFIPTNFDKVSTGYKSRQFLEHAYLPIPEAHYSWRLFFEEEEKNKLLHPHIVSLLKGYNSFENFSRIYDEVSDFPLSFQNTYVDFKTWLADDILTKVDTCSMAHSLEVRSPFLDREIVELAVSIPYHDKVGMFYTKKILKKSLSSELPAYILKRKKEGFLSPASIWLLKELRPLFNNVIESDIFKSFFPNTDYINKIFEEHEKRKKDWGFCLWALLMFGLWAQNYLTYKNQSILDYDKSKIF